MTLEIRPKNLTSLGTLEQGALEYYVLRKKKRLRKRRISSASPFKVTSQPTPAPPPPPASPDPAYKLRTDLFIIRTNEKTSVISLDCRKFCDNSIKKFCWYLDFTMGFVKKHWKFYERQQGIWTCSVNISSSELCKLIWLIVYSNNSIDRIIRL